MKTFLIVIFLIMVVTMSAVIARADLINGSFETGDFSGWTLSGDPDGIANVSSFSSFYPREGGRIASFNKTVVLTYILGLIEWGDTLFGSANLESVNEASNDYGYVQVVGVTLNGDVIDNYAWYRADVRSSDWEYWQWNAAETGYYEVRLALVNNNPSSPSHALFDGVQVRTVPLPPTALLLGSGLLGLVGLRRFRKS
jgi:hypothetical protein